jgi:uncharacterized protein (DUF433 family)
MQKEMLADRELVFQAGLIQSNPSVMMGKPVVAGTRITVESILEKLASGRTVDEIIAAHPRLTEEGIEAALAFAARVVRSWSLPLIRDENEPDS